MKYDLILTGAGCAGLSFMHYLLQSRLKHLRILIIDENKTRSNDKTWCYWANKPLEIHPKKGNPLFWNKISVSDDLGSASSRLTNLSYYHVRSIDFYQSILEQIKAFPNIHWLNDSVVDSKISKDGIKINTANNGSYLGGKIINSIPQSKGSKKTFTIRQVFVGWTVKSKSPSFDSSTAQLMKFDQLKQEEVNFFYILPFNENEALIEYTLFTTDIIDIEAMENQIEIYLRKNLKIKEYEIMAKENGMIPMTTKLTGLSDDPNWINIGTSAGCTKPSTGFTFYNIQKHSQQVVDHILGKKNHSKAVFHRKSRFNFYDNILLNIISKWPAEPSKIFRAMFKNNPPEKVLKFLNEETTLLEEVQILMRLPFKFFIKSLLQYERH